MRWKDGYSAAVEIRLIVDGRELSVAQVGPRSLILRQPCELPSGDARIIIKVDDHEEEHDVILRESNGSELVGFTSLP